jgi:hypothetical protein
MVGKYEVLSEPLPGATHLRRYTVFLGGRRIGATVSMPSESDCLYLEKPPPVPPLKSFQVIYRPGRPKKGAAPAAAAAASGENGHAIAREDLPHGAPVRELANTEDG